MRRAYRACACLALLACSGRDRIANDRRPGVAKPSTPPVVAPPRRSIVTRVLPTYAEPRVVETDLAKVYATAGSLRVELARAGATFASDLFVDDIVGAARVADGWVFASADGSFARASTFSGPLTYLGEGPRELASRRSSGPSCGRLARGFGDTLYSTTGGALATTRAPGVIAEAAFASPSFGGIVLAGGALHLTRDGGATFAATDLVVRDLRCEAGKLRALTSTGTITIAEDGARDTTTPPVPITLTDEELFRSLRREALRRWPELAASAALWEDGQRCQPERWGPHFAIVCPDAASPRARATSPLPTTSTVYRIVDGELRAAIHRVSSSYVDFSDDGLHATWSCTRHDPKVRRPPVRRCVFDGKSTVEHAGYVPGRALHGSNVLLFDNDKLVMRPLGSSSLAREWSIAAPQPFGHFTTPTFSGDGKYAVGIHVTVDPTTSVVTSTHAVLVGLHRDNDIEVTALPAGATRVGFVDGDRGIAAGADLASLWRTTDAGNTWVPLAVDGPPLPARRAQYSPAWLPEREIVCRGTRCSVDHRVEIDLEGAAEIKVPIVVGSRRDVAALQTFDPMPTRKLVCSGSGVPPADPSAGRQTWVGEDLVGPFRFTTAPARVLAGDRTEYDVIARTRNGALVARSTGRVADHVWYAANGTATTLDEKRLDDTWLLDDAIARSDGGIHVIGIERDPHRHTFHSMYQLDRRGKIVAKRLLAWPLDSDRDVLAAFVDGRYGAMQTPRIHEGPRTFVAFDGSARAMPTVEVMPVCDTPTPATAIGSLAIVPSRTLYDSDWRVRRLYVRDLDGPGACIAGVGLFVHSSTGPRAEHVTIPARGGRFVGKSLSCDLRP